MERLQLALERFRIRWCEGFENYPEQTLEAGRADVQQVGGS